jgi:Ca2+-binding EF-hand superfamily protein
MRIVWTIAFGLLALPAVQAQDGRGPGRGRFLAPNVGFMTLDSNGDGVVDAAEIAAAPASLAKLDKDGDGQITSDEVRMAMPQGQGRGGPGGPGRGGPGRGGEKSEAETQAAMVEETVKNLMAFDANGDGKLSRSELPERFQGLFDRGDANKDGFLTPDEIRKMAAAQAAPPDGRGGERGERGGRGGEGPRREMNFIRMDPVLAAVDTDGDGIISAEEIKNSANALRKLDKDGDGKLTREEVTPVAGPGRQF